MSETIKVGDTLCVVSHGWRRNTEPTLHEGTVTKVGRKYLTIKREWQDLKVEIDGLRVAETGYSVWRSAEEFHESRRLAKLWGEFHGEVRNVYHRPKHVTAADIETMLGILRNNRASQGESEL